MIANHIFSAFSFISFVLVSIPLAWHLEALNTAACLHMLWVSMLNLAFFVNSVVWDDNVINWSPVWCDISSHLVIGTSVAIPATLLCIQRRIYLAVLNPTVAITRAEKRRWIVVDMMLGLGLPIVAMSLIYIVQSQRYDILEDFGCRLAIKPTVVGVMLSPLPSLSISLISGIYGCLNIYHLRVKQRSAQLLKCSSAGGVNFSRYLRLFMLSGVDLLFTIPVNIWEFTTWFPLYHGMSWTEVHADFSRIDTFPATLWRSTPRTLIWNEMERWIVVLYGIMFFIFFGFTDEARRHYRLAFQAVASKLGYQKVSSISAKPRISEDNKLQHVVPTCPYPAMHTISSEDEQSRGSDQLNTSGSDGNGRGTFFPPTNPLDSAPDAESKSKPAPSSDARNSLPIPQRIRTIPHSRFSLDMSLV